MTFLANTKKSQHQYITFLGFSFLLNTLQSLTPQRFQRFHEEGYGLIGIKHPKRMTFTKKVICVSLGFLGLNQVRNDFLCLIASASDFRSICGPGLSTFERLAESFSAYMRLKALFYTVYFKALFISYILTHIISGDRADTTSICK